jgi:protein TonB
MYAGTAYAVLNWPRAPIAAGDPPAAVMIELAPLPVAPEVPEQTLAVGPEAVMADESSPSELKQEPVEEQKTEPPPQSEERTEETAQTDMPKLKEIPDAAAVLPAPAETEPPKPEESETKPEPPKPSEEKPSPPKPQSSKAAKATTAPKPIVAPRAATNAAPTSGISSSMSNATWRGMVIAHLNRLKRAPGGSRGTATVAFSIDRRGNVKSARLARSSGIARLDGEAVALVRRASPVPAPPPNVKGNSILLSVPVSISR